MGAEKMGAVILAAGKGQRFHGKKQFVCLGGTPLWEIVYQKAAACISQQRIAVVGVGIPGGETRTGSVLNGLRALPADTSRVIILEAARPLVTRGQIEALLCDPADSSAFVMPLVNTVVYREGRYINRDELYELLTPQAFHYSKLLEALRSGGFTDMTDETRVMFEYWNIPPHFIETTDNLIKVTYQKDLKIIEQLYKEQEEGV